MIYDLLATLPPGNDVTITASSLTIAEVHTHVCTETLPYGIRTCTCIATGLHAVLWGGEGGTVTSVLYSKNALALMPCADGIVLVEVTTFLNVTPGKL